MEAGSRHLMGNLREAALQRPREPYFGFSVGRFIQVWFDSFCPGCGVNAAAVTGCMVDMSRMELTVENSYGE